MPTCAGVLRGGRLDPAHGGPGRLLWITFYRHLTPRADRARISTSKDPKAGRLAQGRPHHLLVRHARPSSRSRPLLPCPRTFPIATSSSSSPSRWCWDRWVIQGLTLRPLILAFGLKDDDPVGIEVARARTVAYRAALDAIEDDPSEEAEILRLEYARRPDAGGRRSERRHHQRRTARRSPAPPRHRGRAKIDLRPARDRSDRRRRVSSSIEEELDRAELSAGG